MRKGFKMKLYPGMQEEYEKRHSLLWTEMKDMIHEHGGRNYTIFLDEETLTLFGYIEIEDLELWAKGADTATNRKWWDFMADVLYREASQTIKIQVGQHRAAIYFKQIISTAQNFH